MRITLIQFEAIDALNSTLAAHGDFLTCADPRGYIATSNSLFDACVDAIGFCKANDFASTEECAAFILTGCLTSAIETVDEEADLEDEIDADEARRYENSLTWEMV